MDYSFADQLNYSSGQFEADVVAIHQVLPNVESVDRATAEEDRAGVDYWVTFKSKKGLGRQISIDVKHRRPGSSQYWRSKQDPELALERYSRCPSSQCPTGVVGWTLDPDKATDYVMFRFDPTDCGRVFLFPFQQLRQAFLRLGATWKRDFGKSGDWFYESSNGGAWKSAAVFVPASHVQVGMALASSSPMPSHGGGLL